VSDENVKLVAGTFDTFCRSAWESGEWLQNYHPELVYHPREDEPDTEPFEGRDRWERIVGAFMDAFDEITFDIEETFDAGDWAIVSTVMHARGGQSGVEIEDRYVFAYRVRDAVIVEGWEHHTMDEAQTALRERISADST
jgi:ketosteroid isomerase-like protein